MLLSSSTLAFTAFDASISAFFSGSVSSNSITYVTPSLPSFAGTPRYTSSIPY